MDEVVDLEPSFVELDKAVNIEVAGFGDTSQPKPPVSESHEDAIEPPLDLHSLARLSHTNSMRRSIIDAIARNTVGLGYSLVVKDGKEEDVSDQSAVEQEIRDALEGAAARDRRLDSPSFTELLMAVKTDEEEVGNGYLEVSRNRLTGKIDGLYHAPGKRVRRRKDRDGFLLLGPHDDIARVTPFYVFGTKVEYDASGQPTSTLQAGRDWRTNELIPFRIYSSESRDYGLPRDVAMALDYAGDKLAGESNISFFDSSGTPPTVIFIQGEENNSGGKVTFRVPQNTVDRIAHILKSDGGHRHRVGIIPLPPGAKVTNVQLGKISDRDVGFSDFRKDNKRRQLAAFRLSGIFVSDTDDGGRYTAEVQRSISLEQVFDPEQERYETRLEQTLLNDLGYPQAKLVFKRLAVENDAARRDSVDKMAEVGTVTRREHRKAHGYSPLPEAKESQTEIEWQGATYKSEEPKAGEVPHGWNDEIVQAAPPAGANNRVVDGTGQQGLRPGIGARSRRQPTRYGKDTPAAAGGAASLRVAAESAGRAAANNGAAAAKP